MIACQIILFILLCVSLLKSLWTDFYGVEYCEPYGFWGAVVSILLFCLCLLIFTKAGAFNLLW